MSRFNEASDGIGSIGSIGSIGGKGLVRLFIGALLISVLALGLTGCGEFKQDKTTSVTIPGDVTVVPVAPVADTVWAVAVDRTPSGAEALPLYLDWLGSVVLPDAAKAHAQVVVFALVDRAGAYTPLGAADFSDLGSDNEIVTSPLVTDRSQALLDEVADKAPKVALTPTNPVASLSNAMKLLAAPGIKHRKIILLSDAVSTRPAGCNLVEIYADGDPAFEKVAQACASTLPLDLTGVEVAVYGAATSSSVELSDLVVARTQQVVTAIVTNAGGQLVAWTPDPKVGAR